MLKFDDEVFEGNLTCSTKQDLNRKLSCGLIHDWIDFVRFAQFDNFECCTIKLKPSQWADDGGFRRELYDYMRNRGLNYYLVPEVGKLSGLNLHYHGLIGFPTAKSRRLFVSWLNKRFGKFYASNKGDVNGWYKYITKGQKDDSPYLFDPKFEPESFSWFNA